jgi:septum site-determining protein MinD
MAELEAELGGLKQHLTRLLGVYDFILIDSAPGVNDEVRASMEVADEVLIVTNPEMPAVKNAQMVKELADKLNKPVVGVVVNIVRNEKHELSIKEIEYALHARVVGVVREHSKVREAISHGIPVVVHAPRIHVSREIKRIAHHLLEEEPPKESLIDKITSFLTREIVIQIR